MNTKTIKKILVIHQCQVVSLGGGSESKIEIFHEAHRGGGCVWGACMGVGGPGQNGCGGARHFCDRPCLNSKMNIDETVKPGQSAC